jgi:hypothetical protein
MVSAPVSLVPAVLHLSDNIFKVQPKLVTVVDRVVLTSHVRYVVCVGLVRGVSAGS